MKLRYFIILSLLPLFLSAQTSVGLRAHYTFEGNFNDVTGNTSNTGTAVGTPSFGCGVHGQALLLDGANDQLKILNQDGINKEFDGEDFSFSFYFKPIGLNGVQYLISKRDTACAEPRQFFVRYVPTSQTLNAFFAQDEEKDVNLLTLVENTYCWQHVAVVRDDTRIKLYVNGVFATDLGTASRVDLETPGSSLYIGGGDCLSSPNTPFSGLIDDVRIYDRALNANEVAGLFFRPDQILTPDTLIFLGNGVDIDVANSCGSTFSWTPSDNVFNDDELEPYIEPDQPGDFVYHLDINDPVSACIASDSIKIRVIDPDDLDCSVVYLPKAFSPNDDGLNDTYGISNPFAVDELISFEIFDRWGGRVFVTNDPFEKWDGTFQGERLNPGVLLYRVNFKCDGEESLSSGNVTIVR